MYIMVYRAHLVDKRGVGALHISWFAWRQGKTRRSTIPGLQIRILKYLDVT